MTGATGATRNGSCRQRTRAGHVLPSRVYPEYCTSVGSRNFEVCCTLWMNGRGEALALHECMTDAQSRLVHCVCTCSQAHKSQQAHQQGGVIQCDTRCASESVEGKPLTRTGRHQRLQGLYLIAVTKACSLSASAFFLRLLANGFLGGGRMSTSFAQAEKGLYLSTCLHETVYAGHEVQYSTRPRLL